MGPAKNRHMYSHLPMGRMPSVVRKYMNEKKAQIPIPLPPPRRTYTVLELRVNISHPLFTQGVVASAGRGIGNNRHHNNVPAMENSSSAGNPG